jgi:hypothetical protein
VEHYCKGIGQARRALIFAFRQMTEEERWRIVRAAPEEHYPLLMATAFTAGISMDFPQNAEDESIEKDG